MTPTWATCFTRNGSHDRAEARAADTGPWSAKKDKANITQHEKKALQFAAKVFLDLSPADLTKALQAGVLLDMHCVQQAR